MMSSEDIVVSFLRSPVSSVLVREATLSDVEVYSQYIL